MDRHHVSLYVYHNAAKPSQGMGHNGKEANTGIKRGSDRANGRFNV